MIISQYACNAATTVSRPEMSPGAVSCVFVFTREVASKLRCRCRLAAGRLETRRHRGGLKVYRRRRRRRQSSFGRQMGHLPSGGRARGAQSSAATGARFRRRRRRRRAVENRHADRRGVGRPRDRDDGPDQGNGGTFLLRFRFPVSVDNSRSDAGRSYH